MIDLLGPGGRLVFYGATSGYTLTFLGKPGTAPAVEMLGRAGLRPTHGVLVYWRGAGDAVGADAVATALRAGARVVVATRTDAEAAAVQAAHRVQGVVSLETLARTAGLRWPEAMPDYDTDPDGYRAYQDATLKPFGLAVGRLLAAPDNPRGNPDLVVERAGQDTLGVSTFLARPFTGVIVYLEDTAADRLSFYAPNVWMHQKRVLFPGFAILGSHLSNAHQAEEVVRLIEAGALAIHPPAVHALGRAGRGAPGHPREPPRWHADRARRRHRRPRRPARGPRRVRGVGLALRRRQGRAGADRSGAAGAARVRGAGDDRRAAGQRAQRRHAGRPRARARRAGGGAAA